MKYISSSIVVIIERGESKQVYFDISPEERLTSRMKTSVISK